MPQLPTLAVLLTLSGLINLAVLAQSDVQPRRTLYVSPAGDDTHDGSTAETAWRSLSFAATQTEPGDLVLVAAGVYREQVVLDRPGTAEAPIVFRATPGEEVVVTAALPDTHWQQTQAASATWWTTCEEAPARLLDRRTMRKSVMVFSQELAEEMPGSYYFDADSKRLYVHPFQRLTPSEAGIVVTGPDNLYAAGFLVTASHNRIEGFVLPYHAAGLSFRYNPEHCVASGNRLYGGDHGIFVNGAKHLTLTNNDIFLNDGFGIELRSSETQAITLTRNRFIWNGPRGPLGRKGDEGFNISFYSAPSDILLESNLIVHGAGARLSDGQSLRDKRVVGPLTMRHNTFIGGIVNIDMNRPRIIMDNTFIGAELREKGTQERLSAVHVGDDDQLAGNLHLPLVSHYSAQSLLDQLGDQPLDAEPADNRSSEVPLQEVGVVSTFTDRALIRWQTPDDYAHATLTWHALPAGDRQQKEVPQNIQLHQTKHHALLTDLEPSTTYRLQLLVSSARGHNQADLTFTTPATNPPPSERFVSPQGNDGNDGSSRETAYRTISKASMVAAPGDTIRVAPGIYREHVRIWQQGLSPEHHLTFVSEEPGQAILDANELFPYALTGSGIRHVTIDGFRVRGLVFSGSTSVGAFGFSETSDLHLVRNIFEAHSGLRGRRPGYMTTNSMQFTNCHDILIRDNLFHHSFRAINLWGQGTDNVTIDHNTFYRAGLYVLSAVPASPDARFTITNNIFYHMGKPNHANLQFIGEVKNLELHHNLYWPPPQSTDEHVHRGGSPMVAFLNLENGPPAVRNLEDLRTYYKAGTGSLIADPMVIDPAAGNFTLSPDSPARGAASDGANLGMRNPPASKP